MPQLGALHGANSLDQETATRPGASEPVQATCPVSTAVFIRIAAEAAWEDIKAGVPPEQVTPFWRVVQPDSTIAKKLRVN